MKRIVVTFAVLALAGTGSAQELKDPTRAPMTGTTQVRREAPAPRPRVTAIFVSSQRRVATFDDQPVHVGDRVGGYLIEEITRAGVRYRCRGQSLFASLEPASP
jgi:hypothetical protein